MRRLVESRHVEPDRAGIDRRAAVFRHQRNDAGRIHAARQKRPQRDIGHHARSHPFAKMMQQLRRKVGFRSAVTLAEVDIPPLDGARRFGIVAQEPVVAGAQFFDPFQDRTVIGDIPPGEIVLHRPGIDIAAQQRMREKTFQLACESETPVTELRREQRLHPQPVARQEQGPVAMVVKCEGEHAVQAAQAIRPPFLPGGEDDFGIAIGPENGAEASEFTPQFGEIVDLAIEDDGRPAIGGMHRLRRPFEIDDRQAPVAEPHTLGGPYSGTVRAAMSQRVGHLPHAGRVHRLRRPDMEKACDPAHGRGARAYPAGRPSRRPADLWTGGMRQWLRLPVCPACLRQRR